MSDEPKMCNPTLSRLAHDFVSRALAQGWKGKTRDKHAIEFFAGACATLEAIQHPDRACVLNFTTFLLCTRGYSEIDRVVHMTPSGPLVSVAE